MGVLFPVYNTEMFLRMNNEVTVFKFSSVCTSLIQLTEQQLSVKRSLTGSLQDSYETV